MEGNSSDNILTDKQKFKLIDAIEQMSVTIIMTDIDGNIQYVNQDFERISGYCVNEAIGKNPRILKSGLTPDDVFEDMWETITKGEPWKGELINKRKDGTIYYEEARITPILDDNRNIVNFLGVKQDISKRKYLEEKLKQTSIRDGLTNIYNRRYVFERLLQITEAYKRKGEMFSLVIIDLDFFKSVNDNYGHQAGDYILKEFAEILANSIRAYDILGRYGGEEFILILQYVDKNSAEKIMERILDKIRETTFNYEDKKIGITFSCGIADISETDKKSCTINNIINYADKRLYKAKNSGRNKIVID